MNLQEQGAALLEGGRFHEALAVYGQWLQQTPASLDARIGMARACRGAGDPWTAMAWASDACRVAPQNAAPMHLLCDLLMEKGQFAQALPLYQRLSGALGQRDRATLLHLPFCHEQLGQLDDAVLGYREALAVFPDFMEAHVDLAGVLWRVGEYEAGHQHALKAQSLAPDHPFAVRMVGTTLLHLNRLDEAETALRRALQLQPGFVLAELDLALTLLLAGRLAPGWRTYHHRWRDTSRMQRPPFFNPALEWLGPQNQPLAGKRIVVYAEQGQGDVLQFIRYARLLQADGATVHAVVPPDLVTLVESLPGVTCSKPGVDLQADGHVALLDLPMHYGTTLDDIPAAVPYLQADGEKVAAWRERLKPWSDRLKVGIAWAGNPAQVNDRNRSMSLSLFKPLMELEGVACFSLQKADGGRNTDMQPGADQLVDWTGEWADFSDSAAMLECLDLVITVDTAVAHLAGALARPTWLLLPPNVDWRWLLEREDSPWYPTLRLFRRGFGEAPVAQMDRVVRALKVQRKRGLTSRQGVLPI